MAIVPVAVPDNCQHCPHLSKSVMGSCQLSELGLISGSKMSQRYQRGQIIFQEGSRPTGMHCIHQGRVKVLKVSGDGKEQILGLRKEGDALGSQALADSGHYAYSAVALSDCVVCMVPRPDFYSLLEQNSQFSHAILKLLAQTLGETQKRLLHTAYKPVRERLAEALLLLYRFFQPEAGTMFSIPISREDLAALMSTAKETASRLLSEFRDEGLVATQGSRIIVLDLKGLQKISALHA